MKKNKQNLSELKAKSFITEMDNQTRNTAKGGGTDQNNSICWECSIGDPNDTLDIGCGITGVRC